MRAGPNSGESKDRPYRCWSDVGCVGLAASELSPSPHQQADRAVVVLDFLRR